MTGPAASTELPIVESGDKRRRRFRAVSVPSILQLELVECGAACLGMILAFFGRWVMLEDLRQRCGVSRDGSTARNVLRAARGYGLIAEGSRRDIDDLPDLPLPFVIFWNFNHFVVVTGFEKRGVRINDPAVGRRLIPAAEFDRSFTGVVLTFRPGPGFTAGGRPSRLADSFVERLSGSWVALGYIMLVGALLVVPGVVVPAMTKIFIDEYLVLGLDDWLRPLILAMTVGMVLAGIMTWLQQRYLLRLQVKLSLSAGAALFHRLLTLPAEFFAQRAAADINNRLQSIARIASVLAGGLSANLVGVATILLYAAVMLTYSPALTAIAVVTAAINLGAVRIFYLRRHDAARLQLKAQGRVTAIATNALQKIESVKATAGERDLFDRWSGAQAQFVSVQQQVAAANAVTSSSTTLLGAIASNLILCLGALHVISGSMTIGDLVAFQLLVAGFNAPVRSLLTLGTTLPQASADVARVDDVMRAPAHPRAPARPALVGGDDRLSGHLELRNVTFGYSPLAPPLIKDISLVLRPGQRVAVVGRSGSGKSTLVRLAAGLFTPWGGRILLDGAPIAEVDPQRRAASVALVDQDIVLFGATIAENLTLWDNTVPDADLVTAARDAQVGEVIAGRLGGYRGTIAEGGSNFSGGERQRLEIARALVGQPTLLLMDEATSALDPIVEQRIDDGLRRRGCACLIVAHRLSTIRDCDEIIVLERGNVVQRGSHNELIDSDGEYARLVRSQ